MTGWRYGFRRERRIGKMYLAAIKRCSGQVGSPPHGLLMARFTLARGSGRVWVFKILTKVSFAGLFGRSHRTVQRPLSVPQRTLGKLQRTAGKTKGRQLSFFNLTEREALPASADNQKNLLGFLDTKFSSYRGKLRVLRPTFCWFAILPITSSRPVACSIKHRNTSILFDAGLPTASSIRTYFVYACATDVHRVGCLVDTNVSL